MQNLSFWLLPPAFKEIINNFLRYKQLRTLSRDYGDLFSKNKKFRNIHLNQRCFILATGPSINKQDLRPLKNEHCISVGGFYLHKDISQISPEYHVEAPNHPPFEIDAIRLSFNGYKNYFSENTTIFLGYAPYEFSYVNFLQKNPEFNKKNIYFLNYIRSPQLIKENYIQPKIWDLTKCLFGCRTVIYSAIQVAVYMGFNQIYLLGCDHDYLVDVKRVSNHHFYKEEDGISDVEHLSAFTSERWFEEYYYRWKQYRLMNEYLTSKGVNIYNATEGGLLDVFPQVEFDKLF